MDKIFAPIKGRIIVFVEKQGIKKNDFFMRTDISPSNFKGKGGESEIGGDKIAKILTVFPEINPIWLLTGQGEMLAGASTSVSAPQEADNSFLYNMYKEKEAKIEAQAEQIGALKQQVKTLEKQLEDLGFGEIVLSQQEASVGSTRTRKTGAVESGSVRFADQ